MRIRWFRVELEDQSLSTPYMTSFLERFRVFLEIDWYHLANSDQKELAPGHDTNKWLTVKLSLPIIAWHCRVCLYILKDNLSRTRSIVDINTNAKSNQRSGLSVNLDEFSANHVANCMYVLFIAIEKPAP